MFDIKKAREKGLDERTIAILEKMNVNSVYEKNLAMVMCLKGLRLTGWEDIYAKSVVAQRIQHGSAGITEELNIQKQTLKSINWLFLLLSEIVKYYQKD